MPEEASAYCDKSSDLCGVYPSIGDPLFLSPLPKPLRPVDPALARELQHPQEGLSATMAKTTEQVFLTAAHISVIVGLLRRKFDSHFGPESASNPNTNGWFVLAQQFLGESLKINLAPVRIDQSFSYQGSQLYRSALLSYSRREPMGSMVSLEAVSTNWSTFSPKAQLALLRDLEKLRRHLLNYVLVQRPSVLESVLRDNQAHEQAPRYAYSAPPTSCESTSRNGNLV
ncbi:hypothetical protein JCM3766R1_006814 [Sporobolomyces carnicolor]